uniref:Si:ch211-147a11.3 n=1 Tax=Scophthalmus maximus TaxID=52904 RepID=A0A8D3AAY9_SCOMX
MPGQLDSSKTRKRKSSSDVKSSRKVCVTCAPAARRRCLKSPKTPSATESSSLVGGHSRAAGPPKRHSRISCECHQQSAGGRRCSASPELRGQEGKENELRAGPDADGCRANGLLDKRESEEMDCEETGKDVYPDDDSNQILPVEQFFGNLDVVQDFPQGSSLATSGPVHRENRRRHYYARDDSDEEEVGFGGTPEEAALSNE